MDWMHGPSGSDGRISLDDDPLGAVDIGWSILDSGYLSFYVPSQSVRKIADGQVKLMESPWWANSAPEITSMHIEGEFDLYRPTPGIDTRYTLP